MKQSTAISRLLLLIISSSAFFGCALGGYPSDPYDVDPGRQKANVYAVSTIANAPLLSKKNSFLIGAHYGSNRDMNNSEVHSAIMPGKKLGLMLGYSSGTYKSNKVYSVSGSRRSVELGGGYVLPLRGSFRFEVYAGWSNTSFKNNHHTGTSKIESSKWFIQPAFYVRDKADFFQFAFVPKFSLNNFKVKYNNFDFLREPLVERQFDILNNGGSQLFFEPSIILRAGSDQIKFQAAISFLKNLSGNEIYTSSNAFALGLVFTPHL